MTDSYATARAGLYETLSLILDGDVDQLVALREDENALADLCESVGVDPEPLLAEATRDELQQAYDELFVIPGPRYVPLFASSHTRTAPEDAPESPSAFAVTDGGRLGGEVAGEAERLYSQFGYEPERGEGVADHVANLLGFTARTAASEEEQVKTAHRRALDLLGWLDSLKAGVVARDETRVWGGLITLTHAIVHADRDALAEE